MITSICIQPGYTDREAVKAFEHGRRLGYTFGPPSRESAPIGSVDWCEELLGWHPEPDFYPGWLASWRRRAIRLMNASAYVQPAPCFVKSAERYKAFEARIYNRWERLPDGYLCLSEPVEFTQEWRYYVADGCVLTTGWYDGHDDDEPAPELDIAWPAGWCGAADFGRLTTGEIALVECQHPYACGWYGDDHAAYVYWVVTGWEWMLKQSSGE